MGGRPIHRSSADPRELPSRSSADRGCPPAAETLEPLEDALQEAHAAGLVHGGVSSTNILIEPNGTPFLADLGIADRGSFQERIGSGSHPARDRRLPTAPRAELALWDGGLNADSQAADPTMLEGELMLRADVEFGARPDGPEQLIGEAAASAPAGDVLAETALGARGIEPRAWPSSSFPRGSRLICSAARRLARLMVADVDPDGEFVELAQNCGGAGDRASACCGGIRARS